MNLNVGYTLLRNVHEHPGKLAVIFKGKRYTYKAFNERVNRLANALLGKGVTKGDKVAYLPHPGVKEAAAIGVKDKEWGERVMAVVVLKEEGRPTEEDLLSFCKERLAGYKRPRSVAFVDELPKNQLGKVLYKELRNRFDRS